MRDEISPDHILQIGFGFWPSKTLLSAVELELFSLLADGPKTGLELQAPWGSIRAERTIFSTPLLRSDCYRGTAPAKPANTAIRLQPHGFWLSRAPNTSVGYSKWRTHVCIGSGPISRPR
jgi:hypothetical protein